MAAPDDVTGPINIGNPVETTVGELAEKIIALIGSRSTIERRPLPVDDPVQRCPDISRARDILAWEPRVPLAIGLERTIAYFDRLLSAGNASLKIGAHADEQPAHQPIS